MKKTMQKLLFALVMGCCTLLSHAQQRTVTGTVTDETGKPIPGATITVKGSLTATASDEDGAYSIQVADNAAILVASSLGFVNKETAVGSNSIINFILTAGIKSEEEVIVTALGIKREARSLGYSAQKISTSDLMKAAPPDLGSGLMGKAAGLNVTASNGIQGGSQRVVIRGNNSILGNNQALIVVDGIQIDNGALGGRQAKMNSNEPGSGNQLENTKEWGSFLNTLNPDDIQEITVLKGATAAALYGSRGANGVLLITTKKGENRKGLGIDYNFSTLFSNPYRYSDVQNSYGMGLASAMWKADNTFRKDANGQNRFPDPWVDMYADIPGGHQAYEHFSWFGRGASWGPKLDGTEIIWWDGVKRKWEAQPDNREAFYRTGNTSTHNVSINKSGDWGSLRMAYTRLDNTAIIKNTNYNQNNFNLGSNINISKKLKSEITASYNNYNRRNSPDLGQDFGWSTFTTYNMSRDYKPLEFDIYKKADGSKADLVGLSAIGAYPYQNNYNNHLFWHLMEQNQFMTRNQLLSTVKLTAELTPWFNLTGRASLVNANTTVDSRFTPVDVAGLQGQYGIETVKNQDVNLEGFGVFHKDKLFGGDFAGSLMLGASSLKSRMYGNSAWNSGEKDATYGQSSNYPWIIPNKYYLGNTSYQGLFSLPVETWADYNINSVYGIMDLSYKNYLFLQVTGRNDWSSTLPIQNASYFYPSTSLSFVFTDAIQGFKNSNWLNYGKLKLSYAGSANGTDPYLAYYTYSPFVISNYLNAQAPSTFGGVPVRSYKASLPPADALKPQRNTSQEIGLELGFLQNRLGFELTYYATKSRDQILSSSLAGSSGATSVTFNTGELSNRGFEFIVRATPVRTQNFNWNIVVNGAHNKNKVIALADGIDVYPLQDLWGNNGVRMYVKAGEDYGTIYGYDYTYKNGQKIVEPIYSKTDPTKVVGSRYVTTPDLVPIGNAMPKLTGGISNSFRYKRVSLSFLTDFRIGGQIYSADYAASMANGTAPETLLERDGGGLAYTYPDGSTANHGVLFDGVYADGTPNKDVVHYMYKYAGQYGAWSNVAMPRSNAIFNNSWGKLRELTLTYSVPGKVVESTGFIQGLDVSLIGRNLFYLFTTLPNRLNPEALNGIGNAQGIQWAQLPGTREYGVSVKVKF